MNTMSPNEMSKKLSVKKLFPRKIFSRKACTIGQKIFSIKFFLTKCIDFLVKKIRCENSYDKKYYFLSTNFLYEKALDRKGQILPRSSKNIS